jgi:hypothetical protein
MIFVIIYFLRFETCLFKQGRMIIQRGRYCVGVTIQNVYKFMIRERCCIMEETYFKLLPPLEVDSIYDHRLQLCTMLLIRHSN